MAPPPDQIARRALYLYRHHKFGFQDAMRCGLLDPSRSLQSICMDGDFVIRFRRDTSGGGDDGREGYFGKEVCCAAERRGTRATRSVDTQGQERRAAAAEGSDIVEGRRVGSR